MHPILKDWLQNLGCFLPLAFFGFSAASIIHWVSTETGPARLIIIWQAKLLGGQHSPKLTLLLFLIPAVLIAWLIATICRWSFSKFGVYERPTTNVGFENPKQRT